MQRGEPYEAVLEIAPPTISPSDLAAELSEAAGRAGVTAARFINAGPRMIAKLSADRDCGIVAIDPLDRAVVSGERVRWRWTVTPKVAGELKLVVTLTAPVIIDGKETSYSGKSFDKTVTVTVTNQQRTTDAVEWAKNHWVMLVFAGGALLGALRWLWGRIRKPTPPAPPPPWE